MTILCTQEMVGFSEPGVLWGLQNFEIWEAFKNNLKKKKIHSPVSIFDVQWKKKMCTGLVPSFPPSYARVLASPENPDKGQVLFFMHRQGLIFLLWALFASESEFLQKTKKVGFIIIKNAFFTCPPPLFVGET